MNNYSIGNDATLLIKAAEGGLFLPAERIKKSDRFPINLNDFEKRPYKIRIATDQDINSLISIEKECWSSNLRTNAEDLRKRIIQFPEGCLVLEIEGRIVACIYSQRINELSLINQKNCENILSCHQSDGKYIQLLSFNVIPEFGHLGLGDQLLAFMLAYIRKIPDISGIVAVSLCEDYSKHNDISISDYIKKRDKDGLLLDPILRFHEWHGGKISGLIPGYRPKDIENQGNGVLVAYDVGSMDTESHGHTSTPDICRNIPISKIVGQCICKILPDKSIYDPGKPLRDMGMDSMHLYQLLALLNKRLGLDLDSTMFFKYSHAKALTTHLEELQKSFEAAPSDLNSPTSSIQKPTQIEAKLDHIESLVQKIDTHIQRLDIRENTIPGKPYVIEDNSIGEPVAIIGMSCRFPHGADTPEKFWKLLNNGIDAVGEVPKDRWRFDSTTEKEKNINRYGAFIEDIDQFDASFFNISPREACMTDPQQRILLEETWNALENTGIDPDGLKNSDTGVYVGMFGHDYERIQSRTDGSAQIDTYFATGTSPSMASGRLSYFFGFQGPAITIDTACSSSLVAVHMACQSLRNNECKMAIASGINVILSPDMGIVFKKSGMLANDGKCKTFDEAADGYVRSEGCGVVILKPLSEALADNNPVLAVIRGSAINQDGTSNGLTAPNALAQEAVIRKALKNAQVKSEEISYLETHGTGTNLGDPVEIHAIDSIFSRSNRVDPLIIGSSKTNIGHTESASGIAGLIKVVLSMQHAYIPKHLHFKHLNPMINLDNIPAVIPIKGMPWKKNGKPFIAGVSSFGFSGTNAHVVVEAYSDDGKQAGASHSLVQTHQILSLSAKTEDSLKKMARSYDNYFYDNSNLELSDLCFSANTGRTHFDHRLAIVGKTPSDIQSGLKAFIDDKAEPGWCRGTAKSNKIAFLFTGQGAQYTGMGLTLYETQPLFRQTLIHCDGILRKYLKHSLIDVIYPRGDHKKLLNYTAYTQPALFSLEYALAILWRSWGIEPDIVLGHSVGEYVAACLAGVFSLEDALKLIANRAALMQALPANGEMAAVFANEETVINAINPYKETVSIAAYNGPELIVISGLQQSITTICKDLENRGIRATRLNVSHAFHSPLMDPMLTPFRKIAETIAYSSPNIPFVTNVHGRIATSEITTPDYWVNHVRQPVQFAGSVNTLFASDYKIFVEIGPQPVLTGMARRIDNTSEYKWMPSLSMGSPDWLQMFRSLGELYVAGAPVDWNTVHKDVSQKIVPLPNYPFQRNSYWFQSYEDRQTQLRLGKKHNEASVHIADWLYHIDWQLKNLSPKKTAIRFPDPQGIHKKIISTIMPKERSFKKLLNNLESLSISYIINALQEMGLQLEPGKLINEDTLYAEIGVSSKYKRMLHHLMAMIEDEGLVEKTEVGWRILSESSPELPSFLNEKLSGKYPEAKVPLDILERCGGSLAHVLKGSIDPVQLLFPDADTTSLTSLYEDSPAFGPMNSLASQAIVIALASLPEDQELKILEIGAGTGGTTAHILPHLPAHQTTYVFSDVSPLFSMKAKERFTAYPFLRFQTLDIGSPPEEQGYKPNSFHIIVAANVLHATKNIQETLINVKKLLAPGGMLVLVEGTSKRRWIDMIFGMLDGWWLFADDPIRSAHPLLSAAKWKNVLNNTGFPNVSAIQPEKEADALFPQAVIIAQTAEYEIEEAEKRPVWLIFADAEGIGEKIALHLESEHFSYRLIYKDNTSSEENTCSIDASNPDDYHKIIGTVSSPIAGIVHLWSLNKNGEGVETSHMEEQLSAGCGSALYLVQAMARAQFQNPPVLWLITRDAQPVSSEQSSMDLISAPLVGLGRVIQREHPEFQCRLVDIEGISRTRISKLLFEYLSNPDEEPIVAFRGEKRYVARLTKQSVIENKPAMQFEANATYLITGGLGSIGLLVAQWMADNGAGHIVLLGRNKPNEYAEGIIGKLEKKGVNVSVLNADIARTDELKNVFQTISGEMPSLKGVIHSAGIFGSGVLTGQTWKDFETVFQAKVMGAWNLHLLTRDLELDFFVMFSSIVSMIGASGLGNYTAANSFLDSLAHFRNMKKLPGTTINWGPWTRTGITNVEATRFESRWHSQGITTLDPDLAMETLARILPRSISQVGVMDADWNIFPDHFPPVLTRSFVSELAQTNKIDEHSPAQLMEQLSLSSQDECGSLMHAHVRSQVADVLGFQGQYDIDPHQGFFQMGMDSLTSIELRNRLQRQLHCSLPATVAFKYPNIEELSDYLVKNHLPEKKSVRIHENNKGVLNQKDVIDDPIAVIGVGCRFPGGVENQALFWEFLCNGVDAVTDISEDRFPIGSFYHPDPGIPGKISFKSGAFLKDIDLFDPMFFGISPREAISMDPQQRLLLEVSWKALEDAACAPNSLKNSKTGVFIGVGQNDYGHLEMGIQNQDHISVYSGTGNLSSFGPGRISYLLGLQGPAMAIDTACSSSLTAIHLACESLKSKESDMALAGGVHLIMAPQVSMFLSMSRSVSPDGKCRTFDASADGFGRGEGCGVIVLKRLSDAVKNRDNVLAVIRGSAVNHDGPGSGLTVPSETAQEKVIGQALSRAEVKPEDICYVEAHGTATSLGDPIEVNALAAALCRNRDSNNPLLIGSVKTNIGHLEAASGVAGIIKSVLSIKHGFIPPHLHFNTPNPLVDWDQIPIRVTSKGTPWPSDKKRLVGVSSFGMSGINAHIVLDSYDVPSSREVLPKNDVNQIFTLSAKSLQSLISLSNKYISFLTDQKNLSLADLCFTLNTGRSHFDFRLAIIAKNSDELLEKLKGFNPDIQASGVYFGVSSKNKRKIRINNLETTHELAKAHVMGAQIDWEDYYSDLSVKRLALPTYAFEKSRYWTETGKSTFDKKNQAVSSLHPLLGRRLSLPFSKEIRFETNIKPDTPAYVSDHLIFEKMIVPGASHISMVIAGFIQAFGHGGCELSDVFFLKPLIISDETGRQVQVILSPQERRTHAFQLVSCNPDESDDESAWINHMTGRVKSLDSPESGNFLESVEAIKGNSRSILSGDQFYEDLHAIDIQLGHSFRWAEKFWLGQKDAICQLSPPDIHENIGQYLLYPGLLDTCFQMLNNFWDDSLKDMIQKDYVYVPFCIKRLRFFNSPHDERKLWCSAKIKDNNGVQGQNLHLFNETGLLCAEVMGFEFRKADPELLFQHLKRDQDQGIYSLEWTNTNIQNDIHSVSPSHWLIFVDDNGIGLNVVKALQGQDHQCTIVQTGQCYERLDSNKFQVDPLSLKDYQRLFDVINPVEHIIHLWSLDMTDVSQSTSAFINIIYLVQGLAHAKWPKSPQLSLITSDVNRILSSKTAANLAQSTVWGLAKVIDLEHPELECVCVDIDDFSGNNASGAELLLSAALGPNLENQITLRNNNAYVPRIQPYQHNNFDKIPAIEPNAAYLVTGANGALGIKIVEQLVSLGCRYLFMVSRGGLNKTSKSIIDALQEQDVHIYDIKADVSNLLEMQNAMDRITSKKLPLKGIVHCAGIIEDAGILRQNQSRFEKVMQPKIEGSWNLHNLSQGISLDFFICFSSISSVIGSWGQGNYAAANSFMDALMQCRHSLGFPGLSINWGPWAESGMAADIGETRWHKLGLETIPPKRGLDTFRNLINAKIPQVIVLPTNKNKFPHEFFEGAIPPLLSNIFEQGKDIVETSNASDADDNQNQFLNEIKILPQSSRRNKLSNHLQTRIAGVLKISDIDIIEIDEPIFDMGFDSLMSIELKDILESDFDCDLPTTLVFDHPSVELLADYLMDFLNHEFVESKGEEETASVGADLSFETSKTDNDQIFEDLKEMSDDDVLAQMMEDV